MVFIIEKRNAETEGGGAVRESCTVRNVMFCVPHLMSSGMRGAENVARME